MKIKMIGVALAICLDIAGRSVAADAPAQSPFAGHPAAAALDQVFSVGAGPADFAPSGLNRRDYLTLIAGVVDFFKQYQDASGAIIDPYIKREVQYSTPAFAVAAGILTQEAGRQDLLEPATRALTCSIDALVEHRTADSHSDFYIPLIMHAYRLLKGVASPELRDQWEQQLRKIDPNNAYRANLRLMNWNIVSDSGELLRRKDGLVAPEMLSAQMDYLEKCLAGHEDKFTRFGMYHDPDSPLAYDEFARLWLDDMMADGAYDGKLAGRLREFLRTGGLSTLLLLSPSGEWASGGRSAFHNWNEAQTAAICEINANHWKEAGRLDVAGAFKRAAHLAFASMRRWQRPSGELWIVKNRAEPDARLGYETYSYHSQYNLLPMAMLAMAYSRADDSIAERPIPSESGGYVFDLRETFHKIVAAAGGYYVLIDTSADPHYNGTGLQRVHKTGIAFPPLSDSAAGERAYSPEGGEKIAMTPALQWQETGGDSTWHSLAEFAIAGTANHPNQVKSVQYRTIETSRQRVSFDIDYALDAPNANSRHATETYTITGAGVELRTLLISGPPVGAIRVGFPALVSDGVTDTDLSITGSSAAINNHGSILQWQVFSPDTGVALKLTGGRIPTHNGYVQALIGDLPSSSPPYSVRTRISLTGK